MLVAIVIFRNQST